ncbi:monovalent cation/H+ antiporter subunit A [Brevundimonas viscosa]|uniref:Multisubunit potassium/proton antiporter, PhaA subunit /multisubunit potassium/proton antiporter, PhaB subunit n=1 Tax=Brevundimonas viscosa TaxID=871741 RepID=A0A1I6QKJ3_9CAUL|nr:monovalent cation/H+ antiporter subunit A [Brevundimonas viscosa]SFS52975.1 multisubunit potassium/proton antiporter, PhaA subunit /multisubunit potassium/proton antiporter, PhaB subunit [Brevundimonas viscosa]
MLFLLALLPLIGALAPALAIRWGRNAAAVAAGSTTLAALVVLASLTPGVFAGETVRASVPWIPALGLNASLFLDPLGLMFAGMILGIGLLVIIYARFYLAAADPMGRFFSYLLLFQGAMLGIVLSDNVLLLLIFWELTSLSSFLLIGFWRHSAEARQGARMALFVTGGGGLALIGGLLILGNIAGSYDLTVILQQRDVIQASPLYLPALLLILGGCFTKSAQFPFHFWLPHAMAAPTPVSAYLHSATMVKAGVFMLARLWPVLAGTETWFLIVATTGLATMVFAAWVALFKDDLKGLLAYSTISHLGFLTMLFGLGTPMAALAGVFHIINHATFKAALFLNAGIVDHEAGTRDLKHLGGLFGLMPIAGTLALIAGLSMAGVPPLNGFISKEMMLEEAAHTVWLGQPWVFPVLATMGALLSVAYSLRYIVHVYFGPRRDDYPKSPHDPGLGLWGPPALLTALVVVIGLAPATVAGPLVDRVAGAVTNGASPHVHLALWHGFKPALFMSVVAIAAGALALMMHGRLQRLFEAGRLPPAKALFDAGVAGAAALSRRGVDAVQNGSLQRAMAALIGTAVVLGFAGFLGAGYEPGDRPGVPASAAAVVGWIALVTATVLVVLFHRARYVSLIYIGIVGLIISLAFAHLSAPDLALTQISVEVVTILLMLLALNLLPKTTPAESRPWRRVRDGVVACAAGLGVGGAAWAVMTRPLDSISSYFWDNAYSGGGGTNVVNVILVDFRGFDTFGEIIVLGIAALGIFALLETVGTGASGRRVAAWKPDTVRSPEHHPMMLVVATRLLLPLAVAVGLYIFLRGHNQPGGGFIAGLVVSVAILMQYMASGYSFADQRLRADHHTLIGAGVLTAAATGLGSLLFGAPFLTSAFDYFHLPLIGEIELATAMLFDVGVALTVIGAVMLALAQLSRVAQSAEKAPPPETLEAMDVDPSRTPATPAREAGR